MKKQKRDFRRLPILAQQMINNNIEPERLQTCIENLELAVEILKRCEVDQIPEIRNERKVICEKCLELKEDTCLLIKRKRGCSACTMPWNVFHNNCPLEKW